MSLVPIRVVHILRTGEFNGQRKAQKINVFRQGINYNLTRILEYMDIKWSNVHTNKNFGISSTLFSMARWLLASKSYVYSGTSMNYHYVTSVEDD